MESPERNENRWRGGDMMSKGNYEERYREFFIEATGIKEGPYPYQTRLATEESFPELLDVPTGLGKMTHDVIGDHYEFL